MKKLEKNGKYFIAEGNELVQIKLISVNVTIGVNKYDVSYKCITANGNEINISYSETSDNEIKWNRNVFDENGDLVTVKSYFNYELPHGCSFKSKNELASYTIENCVVVEHTCRVLVYECNDLETLIPVIDSKYFVVGYKSKNEALLNTRINIVSFEENNKKHIRGQLADIKLEKDQLVEVEKFKNMFYDLKNIGVRVIFDYELCEIFFINNRHCTTDIIVYGDYEDEYSHVMEGKEYECLSSIRLEETIPYDGTIGIR